MSVTASLARASVIALALPAVSGAAELAFDYSLQLERGGAVTKVGLIKGFEKGDGLNLDVKLHQPSYVYIVTRAANGQFRLSYPPPRTGTATVAPSEQLGPIRLVRTNEDPAVQRLYLIVSLVRLPELESHLGADRNVSEALPLAVRDKYFAEGVYTREYKPGTTEIRYRTPREDAVVVEDIAMRRQ